MICQVLNERFDSAPRTSQVHCFKQYLHTVLHTVCRNMLRTGVLVVACAAVVHRLQRLSIASTKRKANDGRLISSPDETGAQAFVVNSQKNVELYCRRWGSPSASPTAAFLLFHSELLSGTVFKRFAQKMTDKGYVVYAMDLTGYGKSGWQRGIPSHIECYTDYVDDIAALVKVAKRETEDVPIVMYGEGLGATCALAYALNDASNAANVDALIAASAKLQPAISTERAEHGIYGILSKILPSFSGPREDPPYDIAGLFVDAEIGMMARSNFEK